MNARFHFLPWLGLLLVACDKPPPPADNPDKAAAASSTARAMRPAKAPLSQSRDEVRAQLQSAREISSPQERNRALAAAVWEALELDPELASEGFQQLIAGSAEKNQLIQHYAMRLAEQDTDHALQWASELANDEEKSLAFGNIALVLAEKEPERAAKLLSDSGVVGRDFDVAVVQVIQRWAAHSPAAAAAWVSEFDAGEVRRDALQTVVAAWALSDLPAAMSWIAAIAQPTIRQEAVLGMAKSLWQQTPERQAEWLRVAPTEIRSEVEKLRTAE
jgi:hypothetical protein